MKKLMYLIPLFFMLGCNPFSKKEDETEKQKRREQARQEWIDDKNKKFQFLCEMVSYKTCISRDTVTIITKEFCEQYKYAVFEGNKIIDINYDKVPKPKNYDFVERVIKQYQFPRKEIFLIFGEVYLLYRLENIESSIYYIEGTVDDISERIDK